MKITTFFSILTIVASGLLLTTTTVPTVYAETTVSLPAETSVPGCEKTDACYIPSSVNVGVGETVTWSNDDTAAHTVTSGTASGGPDGVFDSSLFAAGTTFSHTFEQEGTFDYFCVVHPWMVGNVIVGEAMSMATEGSATAESEAEITEMETTTSETIAESAEFNVDYDITGGGNVVSVTPDSETSSVIVELNATAEQGLLTITLPRDMMDAKTSDNEDEEFFVLIDGEEVVFEETKTDADRTLAIEFPAGSEEIEIIGTFVVPEFGTIAMMVLTIAIISIVAVSAKSNRLSLMPRL